MCSDSTTFTIPIGAICIIVCIGILALSIGFGTVSEDKNVTITKSEGNIGHMFVGTSDGEVFRVSPEIWGKLNIGETYNVKVSIPIGNMPMIVGVNYQISEGDV